MPQYHESYTVPEGDLMCEKCGIALLPGPVTLSYMGNDFPVELPKCPVCGAAYLPEELAVGKVLQVEKSLEDK